MTGVIMSVKTTAILSKQLKCVWHWTRNELKEKKANGFPFAF
jgi:hypothetical protein